MRKNIHPILFTNHIVFTNGSVMAQPSTLLVKKPFKFLDVDMFNNKIWAHTTVTSFSEQKTRLNKFNTKFKN